MTERLMSRISDEASSSRTLLASGDALTISPESLANGRDPGAELVRLRDGASVTVRRARAEDEPALRLFLSGLCLEARYLRFFTGGSDISYAAHLAAAVDSRHYGLVAQDETGELVGHALYIQLDQRHAEVAVEVADHLHGRGLGTILIEQLATRAAQRGITYFVAEVLHENRAMLDVFHDGFNACVKLHDGTDAVEFSTSSWRLVRQRFDSAAQ